MCFHCYSYKLINTFLVFLIQLTIKNKGTIGKKYFTFRERENGFLKFFFDLN